MPNTQSYGAADAAPDRRALTLLAILLLALFLRVLPVVYNWSTPGVFMQFDSFTYLTTADNLAHGRGFTTATAPPYEPSLYRTPGFPWVLSLLLRLGLTMPQVMLFQAVLSTVTVLVLFLLLERAVSRRVAYIGSLLLAVAPVTISYTTYLLSEIYSAFVLTLAAFFVARFARSNRTADLIVASVLTGLTIVVHPLFLFLPLAVLPLWLIHPFKDGAFKRMIRVVAALAIMYAPTAAWMVRNVRVARYYGVAAVASVNAFKIKAVIVSAQVNGTTPQQESERLIRYCEDKIGPHGTPDARYHCWNETASAILAAHPFTYAWMHVQGMVRELVGPGTDTIIRIVYGAEVLGPDGQYYDSRAHAAFASPGHPVRRAIVFATMGLHGFFLLTFAIGVLVQAGRALRGEDWRVPAALLLPVLYVLVVTGGPEGLSRFRVIYMAFFVTFSAFGVLSVLDAVRLRRPQESLSLA